MQHASKTNTWANDEEMLRPVDKNPPASDQPTEAGDSPEDLSCSQRKKAKVDGPAEASHASNGVVDAATEQADVQSEPMVVDQSGSKDGGEDEQDAPVASETQAEPVSDSDWLRSKTSRLLGLLDEEEQAEFDSRPPERPTSPIKAPTAPKPEPTMNDAPQNKGEAEEPDQAPEQDANVDLIRSSARLFVRNLPYDTTEADLEPTFVSFGRIEEVSILCFLSFPYLHPLEYNILRGLLK